MYYIHPANITLPPEMDLRNGPPPSLSKVVIFWGHKALEGTWICFCFSKFTPVHLGMDHDLSDHAVEIGGFGGCSCTSLPSFHDALIVRGSVALWNRFDVYWGCLAFRVVWLWPLLLGKTPGAPEVFHIFWLKRDHSSKVNVIFQAIIGRGLCDLVKLLGPFFWWQYSGRGLFFGEVGEIAVFYNGLGR